MSKTCVAFALTGSFCTFHKAFDQIEQMVEKGYDVFPILSYHAAHTDTRFYSGDEVKRRLTELTGKTPWTTLTEVEPIGPKKLADLYIIAPMTGVSMAKLAHGIFDTPALLGAKSHLRNSRPVLIAPSTNDGLSTAAENIGKILNMKNVYFVPFGQDDPVKKPRSLVADFDQLLSAAACALEGAQLQPVLTCQYGKNAIE
ncbi:MAG: dipicolinate synthase subunit B [Clostridia bacterium]|nr:dipicolinate synthase subunit B [Clostridia bacterium]